MTKGKLYTDMWEGPFPGMPSLQRVYEHLDEAKKDAPRFGICVGDPPEEAAYYRDYAYKINEWFIRWFGDERIYGALPAEHQDTLQAGNDE